MNIKHLLIATILVMPIANGMCPADLSGTNDGTTKEANITKEKPDRAQAIQRAEERYGEFSPFLKSTCVRAAADDASDNIEICEDIKRSIDFAREGRAKGWLLDINKKIYQFDGPVDYFRNHPSQPEFLCTSIEKLFSKEFFDPYDHDLRYFKRSEINQMLAMRSALMRQWYFMQAGETFMQAREAFWSCVHVVPKYFWYAVDQVTPDTYEKYERRKKN